jgi:hypothetical protein
MKNYDLKGIIVQGNMAILGIQLPKPQENNAYCIYKVYNLSISGINIILIHFKDFIGDDLSGSSNNIEAFSIDLGQVINGSTDSIGINTAQEIIGILIHENENKLKVQNEEFIKIANLLQVTNSDLEIKDILGPGTVGRGTIKS